MGESALVASFVVVAKGALGGTAGGVTDAFAAGANLFAVELFGTHGVDVGGGLAGNDGVGAGGAGAGAVAEDASGEGVGKGVG